MQQQEAPLDGVLKTRPSSVEHAVKNEIHHVKSESDQVKSDRPRSRHKREWKGLLRDADEHPTLQGVVVDTTHSQVESQHKLARTTQPISPKPEAHRKRSRPEDGPKKKVYLWRRTSILSLENTSQIIMWHIMALWLC